MAKRITITDIARRAGVCPATVSLVMNGKYTQGQTAQETAQRVYDAARSLGYRAYRPQPRPTGVPTVGLFIAGRDSFFTTHCGDRLMAGMWRAANRHRANLMLWNDPMQDGPIPLSQLRRDLVEHGVNDLILNVNNLISDALVDAVERLTYAGIRIVTLWRRPEGWAVPCVAPDDRHAIELAVAHLTDLGHRRLAFLSTERERRTEMIELSLREAAHACTASLCAVSYVSDHGARDRDAITQAAGATLTKWFRSDEPPSAVITAFDGRGANTVHVAQSLGIRVPEDLSVLALSNMPRIPRLDMDLTMIKSPIEDMGERATSVLLEDRQTYERLCHEEPILLPVHLKTGETTAHVQEGAIPAVRRPSMTH